MRSWRRGESSRGTRAGARVKEAAGCAEGQTAAGGERGRRGTGQSKGTGMEASSTSDFLTLRQRPGAVARRPEDGGGSGRRWRRNPRVCGSGRHRKAWGARVSGGKARRTGRRGLNRPREALACGPKARHTARGREPELESGSGSVRPKVGDDRWPPPVGDRGRREAEKGAAGPARWAGRGETTN
jgi:hypothetical protein